MFAKYARLIANEARAAKGNREAPALRAAIERARKENMPSDNIERAVKKATEGGGAALESVLYEGYGPGGVALLVPVLTDSRNRSANEIKFIFSEHGGNLASPGAATWAFTKESATNHYQPATTVSLSELDLEKLDALVETLEAHEDVQAVFTNAE